MTGKQSFCKSQCERRARMNHPPVRRVVSSGGFCPLRPCGAEVRPDRDPPALLFLVASIGDEPQDNTVEVPVGSGTMGMGIVAYESLLMERGSGKLYPHLFQRIALDSLADDTCPECGAGKVADRFPSDIHHCGEEQSTALQQKTVCGKT
jgi:hypothetical protein